MSNRFPTTDWCEFIMFIGMLILIYAIMYGLIWGGIEIFGFLYGLWRY